MDLGGLDLTIFTRIGLVLFVGFFVLTVIWIFRRGSTAKYNQTSNLPFEDEASHHE
jgi:cbb3-type cytochrome oxidase subunit 3